MTKEMNKRYILMAFLALASLSMGAQETDSLTVGFRQKVPQTVNSYSSVTAGSAVFERSPEIDVKKALYGQIRGLLVEQGTGTSGVNEATLSLYGKSPLILVDGFARSLSDLTSSEIESITVLTDAVSCALYGVKGANGVVLVNTKSGRGGGLKVSAEYRFGLNTQQFSPSFADAYTYGTYLNQALVNDGLSPAYNDLELSAFRSGDYPFEYPNVNWWDEVYQHPGQSHGLTLNFDGGGDRFRYFTVVDYYNDTAMLTYNLNDDRYSSKTTDVRLNLRTNIDADITKTTKMRFSLLAKLQENNGPNTDMDSFYTSLYNTPAAAFPMKFADGTYGGSLIYTSNNPVALLRGTGASKDIYGKLFADIVIDQNLDVITEGLSASVGISFDNVGVMNETLSMEYAYKYHDALIDPDSGSLSYQETVWGSNSTVLDQTDQAFKSLQLETNLQAKLAYDRTFGGKHAVNAAAIYDQYSYVASVRNSSHKRLSAILNAGYTYDNRYNLNAVVNWSGSSYLPDGDKMRFYPAVSAAWIISNEPFMRGAKALSDLRLHASFGYSGWDGGLSNELWRSSYVTTGSYYFTDSTTGTGLAETALPVQNLTVVKSRRTTVGLDLSLFENRLNFSAEAFQDHRTDILVSGSNALTGIIGVEIAQVNEGINDFAGISASLGWNGSAGDFNYWLSGNISFLTSEIINNNQAYQPYDYLYQKGNKVGQCYGLEAIGFFSDYIDINNSPSQTFSDVRPGDVKYKDQNGDFVIDEKDIVKMCNTNSPELYYGFSLGLEWKGLEFSADFQGVSMVTVNLLNSPLYKPLVSNGNISYDYLDNEVIWTEATKDTATMPRLTTLSNANNYRNSSLWFRDGSFLKLRNVSVAYTFPKRLLKFADMQIYFRATNPLTISAIDFCDPESLTATYPSVRSYWAGIKFNF